MSVTRALLLGGPVSSVLYIIAIDVLVPMAHPDYHAYASQMVSELMAIDAPSRPLLVRLFVPYNLLVFAFALGVLRSARGRPSRTVTAVMLTGYGAASTFGLLGAAMDLRGTVDSQRDSLHILATIVMSGFIVASMALGAFAHGRRFRTYSFVTLALVVIFGALAGWLARPMPGPTPWLGLAERVNIYATMAWFSALAVSLMREKRVASARP